jgi:hypothetical protein
MNDRFWADELGSVLMIDGVVVMEGVCSHGRPKVIAERVRIDYKPFSSDIPVRELLW